MSRSSMDLRDRFWSRMKPGVVLTVKPEGLDPFELVVGEKVPADGRSLEYLAAGFLDFVPSIEISVSGRPLLRQFQAVSEEGEHFNPARLLIL